MDRIRNKYNPEETELRAEKSLSGLTAGEFSSWQNHPCTKALKYTLEAGLDRIVLGYVVGDFMSTKMEATALAQARATGASTTIQEVMNYMDSMLEMSQREDKPYEENIYNP